MNKIKITLGFILSHPLGKRHLIKSLYRSIIWQLQSSLYPSKLIEKSFIKPVKFYARKGLTGITGNIYAGLHDFEDMLFLLHFLRPGDTFYDVGANVGGYTLLASGISNAKSIAFEPVGSPFEILTKNIELNKLQDKASIINSAVGAQKGEIKFTTNADTVNHAAAENELLEAGIVTVPVMTIDSLTGNGAPDLMKIDVEGFETEVLKGMTNTLNMPSLKAIIIELNGSGGRYGYSEEDAHDLLLSKGFQPYAYDPFKRSLTVIKTYGKDNTIYCRDMDFIAHRLQTANGVKVMGEVI
jgi:FkbM family methyltransferase